MSSADGVSFQFPPPIIWCRLYTKDEQIFKKCRSQLRNLGFRMETWRALNTDDPTLSLATTTSNPGFGHPCYESFTRSFRTSSKLHVVICLHCVRISLGLLRRAYHDICYGCPQCRLHRSYGTGCKLQRVHGCRLPNPYLLANFDPLPCRLCSYLPGFKTVVLSFRYEPSCLKYLCTHQFKYRLNQSFLSPLGKERLTDHVETNSLHFTSYKHFLSIIIAFTISLSTVISSYRSV